MSNTKFARDGEPFYERSDFGNKVTLNKIFSRNRQLELQLSRVLTTGRVPVRLPIAAPDGLLVRHLQTTEQVAQIHLRRAAYGKNQGTWYLFVDGGLAINDAMILAGLQHLLLELSAEFGIPLPSRFPDGYEKIEKDLGRR